MIREIICISIEKDGKHYILKDSKGNTAKVTSPESLLDFLLIDAGNPEVCKCVWNLFQLFAVLQQQLPTEIIDTLIKDDRTFYNDYKIFSSSGKVLSIGYTKKIHDNIYAPRIEINVYELRKYFPDFTPNNLDDLIYKSNELLQTFKELGWTDIKTLSSPIAVYDDAVLSKEFIPSIYDMEDSQIVDGLLSYCYKIMCREWRTVYKIGNFQNVTSIDIRSSYPSFIKNFGNTSECKIIYSNKLLRSDFGICRGKLTLKEDYHPIVNNNGKNVIGEYEDYISTEQWAYIAHYKKGTFDMVDGYFMNYDHPDDKPFEEMMINLYNMREHGGLKKNLAKSISVGIWGYQSQEYEERYGTYFNPIYSIMTTSKVALHMGKLIEENHLQDSLISLIVDGCLINKDIDLDTTNVIGGWKKDKVNALVLSIGHQYIESADKNTKDSYQNIYSTMLKAIQDSPSKHMYNNVLLLKGMMNTNRFFRRFPKTGKDLLENIYESEPIVKV